MLMNFSFTSHYTESAGRNVAIRGECEAGLFVADASALLINSDFGTMPSEIPPLQLTAHALFDVNSTLCNIGDDIQRILELACNPKVSSRKEKMFLLKNNAQTLTMHFGADAALLIDFCLNSVRGFNANVIPEDRQLWECLKEHITELSPPEMDFTL